MPLSLIERTSFSFRLGVLLLELLLDSAYVVVLLETGRGESTSNGGESGECSREREPRGERRSRSPATAECALGRLLLGESKPSQLAGIFGLDDDELLLLLSR